MYKDAHVTAVIPAHDEERFIGRVIDDLPALVDRAIVVDDHSTDATAHVASSRRDTRVSVITTPRCLGVGGAMVTGYREALREPTDIVVKVDGDGQMPLEYLPGLLDAVIEKGADYAKGNRFMMQKELRAMPAARLFGNVVLTFLTKLASGYWHVFDPQNGFLAIRSEVLATFDLDRLYAGYFFENDMLIQLNVRQRRVMDVPMPSRYGDETSGVNLLKVSLVFPVLLSARFCYRVYQKYILRDFSPIALFLVLGSALLLGGGVFGAYAWIRSWWTGQLTSTGTVMLSVLPLVLGFQLLLQAIVLDIQESWALSASTRPLSTMARIRDQVETGAATPEPRTVGATEGPQGRR